MAWPLKKTRRVTCAYGVRGPQWMSGWHQGIDIGAPVGDPVYAVADGVVVGVGIWGPNLGRFSPVVHHRFRFRSYYCVYAHVSTSYVQIGDKVRLGQHIADVGVEGNSGGPHLHFEAQKTSRWQIGGGVNPRWMLAYRGNK